MHGVFSLNACMEYTVQMHAWSGRSWVLSRRAAELQGIGSLVKGQLHGVKSPRILSEKVACMQGQL